MKTNEAHFKLFSNCIPVKGANRSVICDLQRNEITLIPNDLYTILNTYEGETIYEIKAKYNNKYDTEIDEYFEFLLEKEYIFFTNTPDRFPKIDLQFHYPFEISNAIIDRNKQSKYNIHDVLDQLNDLRCKFLEIRFFDKATLTETENILYHLDATKSSIATVGIVLPFSKVFDREQNDILNRFPRLSYIIVHSDRQERRKPSITPQRGHIIYTTDKMNNETCCGVINTAYFNSNMQLFTESLHHNSCLNKKIAVDTQGNIKNCPSMPKSFGHIIDTALKEALDHKDFKKYWNITKDQIHICKDCEFRYVCTDCRAYIENSDNCYSKPLKCGYDPYTATWEDWNTRSKVIANNSK